MAKTVMVVDDEADILNIVEDNLKSSGYQVLSASGTTQALEVLSKQLPDLILIDIMMPPGPDGFYLLESMRRHPRWRNIPAVMLTAQSGTQFIVRSQELEAVDYLIKPFTSDELLEVIVKYS